jgi:triosephosphate isomerase
MNKDRDGARAYAKALLTALEAAPPSETEVVVAPPFTLLESLGTAFEGSRVGLAAQNVSAEVEGAHTGEISAEMLSELGCQYCLVGHSERRANQGETSTQVAEKAAALLEVGLRPIICVGETGAEREAGRTAEIVGQLVVAYEPVWAIGTGVTATPEQAQEVQALLRERLRTILGESAEDVRLQYGGSVGPHTIQALMNQPDIDGALIGSAALDPETFEQMIANTHWENTSP